MAKKVDIDNILKILKREVVHYDVPVVDLIEIQTKDPFKVLVATIMSARTKDETTAAACERLFDKVHTLYDLDNLTIKQIEKLIFPVGFYRNKAKHLKALPKALLDLYDGKVPNTVDELVKLPGVGRKTANLVVAVGFDKHAICVDIHVHRITNRWGYVKTKTPFETEMALRDKLPKKYWTTVNSMIVAFGQNLCRPISPKCSICPVAQYCNQIGVTQKR